MKVDARRRCHPCSIACRSRPELGGFAAESGLPPQTQSSALVTDPLGDTCPLRHSYATRAAAQADRRLDARAMHDIMTPPSVSVVIRNRNEAATLGLVLDALACQREPAQQVVVVDNESSDGSRELALARGADVLDIPRGEFTYGRALNVGIAAARGELVLVLSAHALPLTRHFMTDVRAPFAQPSVAATRCLHVGKTRELRAWMEARELTGADSIDAVIARGPLASGCVIRRSVWEELPFDETVEAVEDKFWALRALERGHVIRNSEAMYYYLRAKSRREEIAQSTREAVALYRHSRIAPRANFGELCRDLFVGAPSAAARVISSALLRYTSMKSVPARARRAPSRGAIR
jgi:GT2 family glycosyltransferase